MKYPDLQNLKHSSILSSKVCLQHLRYQNEAETPDYIILLYPIYLRPGKILSRL